MSKEEPKVTECWVEEGFGSNGHPTLEGAYDKEHDWYRPAILMWREDYDAMKCELESEKKWAEHYFREWEKAKKELEELRARPARKGEFPSRTIDPSLLEAHDDEEAK